MGALHPPQLPHFHRPAIVLLRQCVHGNDIAYEHVYSIAPSDPHRCLGRRAREPDDIGCSSGSSPLWGQRVAVGIASANRDERVFDEPDDFRLDRGLPRHISFSGGAHLCMGAGLARLVACETLAAFTQRFAPGEVELAQGFRFEGVPVFLEYGPERLDVAFSAQP